MSTSTLWRLLVCSLVPAAAAAAAPTQWSAPPTKLTDAGRAFAVSGDTAIAGDYLSGPGGTVKVYERLPGSSAGWALQRTITSTPPVSGWVGFGGDVALDGDTAFVGSCWFELGEQGSVGDAYVLERDQGGAGNWGVVQQLFVPSAPSGFGVAVALDGDTAVVGASGFGYEPGAAYIFERNPGGSPAWVQVAGLTPTGNTTFGTDVAVSGDVAVVSTLGPDVYVFERNLGGPGAWGLAATLLGATACCPTGRVLGLEGSTLLVGDPDFFTGEKVNWYTRTIGQGGLPVWSLSGTILPPAGNSGFGGAVALGGDRAIIGAPRADHQGFQGAGAAYVFARSGSAWQLEDSIYSNAPAASAKFGSWLAVDGGTLLCTEQAGRIAPATLSGLALDPSTGLLYGVDSSEDLLLRVNPGDGSMEVLGLTGDTQIAGLAFDPGTGTLYGSDTGTDLLLQIDVGTGATTPVGSLGFDLVRGLAFDAVGGMLYGVDAATDQLLSIDTASGLGTAIGPLGFSNPGSLAFDVGTGLLYATDLATEALFLVDPSTGAGVSVGAHGHEKVGALASQPSGGKLIGGDNHPVSFKSNLMRHVIRLNTGTGQGTVIATFQDDEPPTLLGPITYFFEACGPGTTYCTAGVSASGCSAALSSAGTASATAPSGFTLLAATVEGAKNGLFFFGANGRQANPWGNGTSYQCVVPPVSRAGLLVGTGTSGACDGTFSQDLNALWCPGCLKPQKNPGAGATVQAQLWYRDPANTSNQVTSLSDAIEFCLAP